MKINGFRFIVMALASALAVFGGAGAKAEKVEGEAALDLVSSYIWRGQDLGGVSIQPTLGLSWKGLSLSAWGSTSFEKGDTKEFDLTLGYGYKGFSVSVTDYWFDNGPGYFKYGAHSTAHVFEACLGYDFKLAAINWYTNFAGNDGVNGHGDRAYSSYVEASVPFTLASLDWSAVVGATPWSTDFYGSHGFAVVNCSIGAVKKIKVTDSFGFSLFARAIWNPRADKGYFAAGISF